MALPTREQIIDYLHIHVCYVEFLTSTGHLRKMTCTLRGDLIPECNQLDSAKQKFPGNVCIYDMKIKEWRQFKMNRLKMFQINQDGTGNCISIWYA